MQTLGKAYREGGYDFTSYLLSSAALFNGSNPYTTGSPFPFVYPLFPCVLLFPLTLLPYWFSATLWFIGSVAALYASGITLLRLLPSSLSTRHSVAVCLIPFLILVNVIQNNLLNGQINFLVLLLSVLFLKYYLDSRRVLAALMLSLAISIKLTPLIFVVYLLARRDVLYAGLTLAISTVLILGMPYAVAGQKTLEWYSVYVRSVITENLLLQGQAPHGMSFSITSVTASLFPSMEKIVSVSIAAIVSLLPIVWAQVSSRNVGAGKQVYILGLYLLAIVLINPVSETHHLINLFPAAVLVTLPVLLSSRRQSQIGTLTLAAVLISLVVGRYHDGANILAVGALYASTLWMYLQENEPIVSDGHIRLWTHAH